MGFLGIKTKKDKEHELNMQAAKHAHEEKLVAEHEQTIREQQSLEAKAKEAEANRNSEERKVKINADKEVRIVVEEGKTQVELAQKENEKFIARAQAEKDIKSKEQEEETQRTQILADRDIDIAKSADETNVKLREQQRLENQFLESEITRRGELTLEYMKEELKMLDKDRERKHLEFEKLIDSTRQRQKELQDSFDKTGNIELISQISECESTLKQYISQDKRDEKEYNSNKLILNDKMNQLFITSDSGDNN